MFPESGVLVELIFFFFKYYSVEEIRPVMYGLVAGWGRAYEALKSNLYLIIFPKILS